MNIRFSGRIPGSQLTLLKEQIQQSFALGVEANPGWLSERYGVGAVLEGKEDNFFHRKGRPIIMIEREAIPADMAEDADSFHPNVQGADYALLTIDRENGDILSAEDVNGKPLPSSDEAALSIVENAIQGLLFSNKTSSVLTKLLQSSMEDYKVVTGGDEG